DIKPSNILVVSDENGPRPIVIDFGVAKATRSLTDHSVATQMNQLLGTPLYMSPEQADLTTADVDTRTDVYSLGVVMYELVTGDRPFTMQQIAAVPAYKISDFLLLTDVKLPSQHFISRNEKSVDAALQRQTELRTAYRMVRGDLEAIILKAMDSQRSRRYSTVNELSQDLQRFLNHEPVRARRPTVVNIAGKFVRRNRLLVLATVSVIALLFIGLVTSLYLFSIESQRANQFRRLAAANEAALLQSEFDGLLNLPIDQKRGVIDQWLRRAKAVVDQQSDFRAEAARISRRDSESIYAKRMLQLVSGVDNLSAENGPIQQARLWQQRIPSRQQIQARWTAFSQEQSSAHPDWTITPRPWLYPFRKHPTSGLWELVDLRYGIVPRIGDDGRVCASEDMGLVYVLLPGGRFRMGSRADEPGRKQDEPAHLVGVGPTLISKFEITRTQWDRGGRALRLPRSEDFGPNTPVSGVCWFDCMTFCNLTSSRLPTEAEWEYACRAGSNSPFHPQAPSSSTDGDTARQFDPLDLDAAMQAVGWFDANSGKRLHTVGTKSPNAFFLYDMHGNVSEWCADQFQSDYSMEGNRREDALISPDGIWWNPHFPVKTESRPRLTDDLCHAVIRSGSSNYVSRFCRSADRYHELQDIDTPWFGFRVVLPGIVETQTPWKNASITAEPIGGDISQ
ncbi:MAG: SUMF1/EgtB/PvdO family nonheme iron enzyme, partial [Planctomycetota bacterium]